MWRSSSPSWTCLSCRSKCHNRCWCRRLIWTRRSPSTSTTPQRRRIRSSMRVPSSTRPMWLQRCHLNICNSGSKFGTISTTSQTTTNCFSEPLFTTLHFTCPRKRLLSCLWICLQTTACWLFRLLETWLWVTCSSSQLMAVSTRTSHSLTGTRSTLRTRSTSKTLSTAPPYRWTRFRTTCRRTRSRLILYSPPTLNCFQLRLSSRCKWVVRKSNTYIVYLVMGGIMKCNIALLVDIDINKMKCNHKFTHTHYFFRWAYTIDINLLSSSLSLF